MNTYRLYEILNETTVQVRVGDVVREEASGPLQVITVDAMPAESDLKPGTEIVDFLLLKVGVDKEKAETHRAELIEWLDGLTGELAEIMKGGPSYITLGAHIGSQGGAFQLMALGKVLGLWNVVTPATFGFDGAEAKQLAGAGMIMMTGYHNG